MEGSFASSLGTSIYCSPEQDRKRKKNKMEEEKEPNQKVGEYSKDILDVVEYKLPKILETVDPSKISMIGKVDLSSHAKLCEIMDTLKFLSPEGRQVVYPVGVQLRCLFIY